MNRIIFGDTQTRRYKREWLGENTGNWWYAASYRTRFMAVLMAILCSIGARQRVIDTHAKETK